MSICLETRESSRSERYDAAASGDRNADFDAITADQKKVQAELIQVIRASLPAVETVQRSVNAAQKGYRAVAELLVALRHQCAGRNGEGLDLVGRSTTYRVLVRQAYIEAGANPCEPVAKRLTAGAAYWVRKLLLEKYGESKLRELGVLGRMETRSTSYQRMLDMLPDDPHACLIAAIGILNALAADPTVVPSEDSVKSAARAVKLLESKLLRTANAA